MKKRLLVLLAFGVSFAPPVFASVDGGITAHTGEERLSETGLRGAYCAKLDKFLPEDRADVNQQANTGSAVSADRAL